MLDLPEATMPLNIFYPKVWDSFDAKLRDLLVEKGHVREVNYSYPKEGQKMSFSSDCYNWKLANGEVPDRKWLVYSKELGRVFCFCCKVLRKIHTRSHLAYEGVSALETSRWQT